MTDTTSAAYWSIEIAVGLIAVGVLNLRMRSGRVAPSSTVVAALTVLMVYVVATTV